PEDTMHLWFLYYLAWVTGIVASVAFWMERRGFDWPSLSRSLRRAAESPWRSLGVFGSLSFVWFSVLGWHDLPTSTGWIPDPMILLFYLGCYTTGWILYDAGLDLSTMKTRAWTLMAIGLLCLLVRFEFRDLLKTADGGYGDGPPEVTALYLVKLCVSAVALVAITRGLTGLFIRYASSGTYIWRYISDSSYWVYLLHLPLAALIPAVLAYWDVNVYLKGSVAIALVTLTCLITYDLGVRSTAIGRFLNGRRYPRYSLRVSVVAGALVLGGLGHAVATQVAPDELPSPWRNRASAQALLPDEQVSPSVAAAQPMSLDVSLRRCVSVRSYIICPDKGSYDDAVAACDYLGGGLVVLDSEAKNTEVSDLLWALLERPFYIGLSDRENEGRWSWSSFADLAFHVLILQAWSSACKEY
ncbi:MAG: acyltransferase family protein, partial [Myxococcota bacterium]|nr:acyltransferase family protein [Myxococcota bacterium]